MKTKRSSTRLWIVGVAWLAGSLGGCESVALFQPAGGGGGSSGLTDGGSGEPAGGGSSEPTGGGSEPSGQVLYVSNDGNDQADGLTRETSLRTIARALGLAGPGDTVAVAPGVYEERIKQEGLGGTSASITIRGEGGVPALDGGGTMDIGFWCNQCTNVTLEGLEFRNYTDVGLVVSFSSGVTMRQLDVHDNGAAATLDWVEGYGLHAEDSQDVLIEDNEVYRNGPSPQRPDRWLGTGIDTFALKDSVIRGNRSHDNIGGGILVEDSVNVLVENNVVTSNNLDASIEQWWDGGLWVDGGRDVTVRHNTFMNNLGPGIEISDEDNQQPTGYILENNTSTGNYFGIYVWNFGTDGLPPDTILRVSSDNNLSGNTRQDVWVVPWECPPDDPCE